MGNFQTCGPNEAMVLSGCCQGSDNMIIGGRTWVWAFDLQFVQRLPLNAITIEVHSDEVNSQAGVPVCAVGIAQIKVGSAEECLKTASQLFLGADVDIAYRMIEDVAKETLEGHQRAIIGNMTVEDMQRFQNSVGQQFENQVLKF